MVEGARTSTIWTKTRVELPVPDQKATRWRRTGSDDVTAFTQITGETDALHDDQAFEGSASDG